MIRVLRVACRGAIKARVQVDAVILAAPEPVRGQFRTLNPRQRIRAAAALRPGPLHDLAAATKTALRALARRWLALQAEINDHDASSPRSSPTWPRSGSHCPAWASIPPAATGHHRGELRRGDNYLPDQQQLRHYWPSDKLQKPRSVAHFKRSDLPGIKWS